MDDLYSKYQQIRRDESKRSFDWRSLAFPRQIECIEDTSRLKVYFTTRRGAKSYTDGIELIKDAQEDAKCNCLYLGLTRLSAKAIIWKDVLKDINDKQDLGINFHETELTATTQNGSIIYVAGVDVDENERKKLFGRKYKRVVIDEAALYTIDLYDLVYVTLKPAMTDTRGTIVLSGMSSNFVRGLFFDLTQTYPHQLKEDEAPSGRWMHNGWSCHAWTAHENPHVAKNWQEEFDEIERDRPLFKKTAAFRQAYLNRWVVDEDAKVYKFNRDRDMFERLPLLESPYHYVLGVDLGHSPDPSAFIVGAYHDHLPGIWIIHAEKHWKMDITAVSDKIKELNKKWNFEARVIDGSMKMAIEEMNTRHQTNVIPADKQGKEHWINLFNDEFSQERIKFLKGHTEMLCDELDKLLWVTDNGKIKIPRKEEPSLSNHCTDAMLYMLRYTHSHLAKAIPDVKFINWNAQEEWEPKHIERLTQQIQMQQNPNHLEIPHEELDQLFDFSQDDVV